MRNILFIAFAMSFAGQLSAALGQVSDSDVYTPDSSKPRSISVGGALAEAFSDITSVAGVTLVSRDETHDAYTNVLLLKPSAVQASGPPANAASPLAGLPSGETPASIACIYGQVPVSDGCDPARVKTNASGGKNVIVVVDAFHDPNATSDLAVFSAQFGLPWKPENFSVVFASGVQPPPDNTIGKGWEAETALDVEWAHAMAPDAKIVLVEAMSSGLTDMYNAVTKAKEILAQNGGGELSLSWGSYEVSEYFEHDADFSAKGFVAFAATGDNRLVTYPASSAYVVAVGGTKILRGPDGTFAGEEPWQNAGAGRSEFEAQPAYQASVASQLDRFRGVADIAAVADPQSGVLVYDSGNFSFATNHGWLVLGGTSVATPIIAGIANSSGQFLESGTAELNYMYSKAGTPAYAHVKSGRCGYQLFYSSDGDGWNFCSGLGTPRGKSGL